MTDDGDQVHGVDDLDEPSERERFPGPLHSPTGFVAYATALAALVGARELVPPLVVRMTPAFGTVELRVSTTPALGAWAAALGASKPTAHGRVLQAHGQVGGRPTTVYAPRPDCGKCGGPADVVWSSALTSNPDAPALEPRGTLRLSAELPEHSRFLDDVEAYVPAALVCGRCDHGVPIGGDR